MSVEAADLLKSSHPLHTTFAGWVSGKLNKDAKATKRQARKFLQQFPQFLVAKAA